MQKILSYIIMCLAALSATAMPVRAEYGDSTTLARTRVSLVTAMPGNLIYELEGHTMLRIITPDGRDVCVNWGVFDFNDNDFIYRFVKGETDYMAAAYPTRLALMEYAQRGRRVIEQPLNLTDDEKQRLLYDIGVNLQPQNMRYRYNYVLDNCATRPLNLIDRAAGNKLEIVGEIAPGTTFRSEMQHFHHNYPWYQFGIDLALGSGIDRPISLRESAFAPVTLMALADSARLDGQMLTTGREMLVAGEPDGIADGPTKWFLTPLAVCWALFALAMTSLIITSRRHRSPKLLTTIVFGTAFVLGLLLTFLIFVSSHEATSPNWLYLWLNPLCAIPAVLVWLKNYNKVLVCYHFANFAAILTLATIAVSGLQVLNAAFLPLMAIDAAVSLQYLITNVKHKNTGA